MSRPRHRWIHPTIGLLSAIATAAPLTDGLAGQQPNPLDPEVVPRPSATALPATGAITVDGELTESAWSNAQTITRFLQAQPDDGLPASERTVARVLYDRRYLYVSAVCYDRNPAGIVVKTLERDFPGVISEEMDTFGVAFDTFLDKRNSFILFVNARGGLKDGQGFDDGRIRDYGWDGIVDVKTVVHDSGWTLEMAIPWKTLRFDPNRSEQTWGLNMLRRIRRKNEVAYWAPLDRRDRFFSVSKAGTLRGLPQLPPSRNLTLKPFALAKRSAGSTLDSTTLGNDYDGGFDLKYGITPRMTLDVTFRTDFSQVEVDREQVNLTRFPLFFPEQREFFLENSGTFTFGDVNSGPGSPRQGTSLRDFTLFHSREIGLRGGRPVPLFGGARLTGRAGAWELGVMNVQSEAYEGDPGENFSVVRVRRSVLDNSDVGVIFTNRQATGSGAGPYNRTMGVDANLRPIRGLFINSYLAASIDPGRTDEAARLSVGWRDRLWNASAAVRHIGDAFDPGMGFIRRVGIRHWYATVGAHPRPTSLPVLEINPYVEGEYITDLDGTLLTRTGTASFGVTFRDGGRLSASVSDRFERLTDPFPVRSTATIPVGDYGFQEGSVQYSSSQGRPLSAAVTVSGGGYFDGSRFTVSGTARWQPDYHVTLDFSATHNALEVQNQEFNADVYSARVKYAYSTSLYAGAFVQYNAATEQVVTNARLNLVHAPLSDLFVVFTERRAVASGASAVLERFVTVKVTRLFGV